MMNIGYRIHSDGSFSVVSDHGPELTDLYPCINGRSVRAILTETGENFVLCHLADGDLRLDFTQVSDTVISVRASLKNYTEKIHTLTVLDALLTGDLTGVYQAAGDHSSDSGYRTVGELNHRLPLTSRGLTVLCRKSGYLACYVTDHRRFHQEFRFRKTESDRLSLCGDFRLENVNPTELELPPIYFSACANLDAALAHAAGHIAETMHARKVHPPTYHWCSWYYNYSEFCQSQLTEYLNAFPQTEPGKYLKYFQLDAGYSSAVGDWLSPRSYYPNGLEFAVRKISESGYLPGIWISPFMAGNHSQVSKEHPDWLLRDPQGNPLIGIRTYNEPKLWGYHDEEYYILDTSHPEAMAYLRQVFRTMHSWGVRLFKTDFMLWGYQDSSKVHRHTPGRTSVEYLREVLKMIREEIGDDSYLLGCIAPFYPFIGFADAMRIGGDIGPAWEGRFNPHSMIRTVQGNHYTNGIYYQNDPDAMFFRDFHIRLNNTEIEALALYAAMSGGCTYTSDPLHLLREDRKHLFDFLRPDETFRIPFLPYKEKNRDEVVLVCRNPENTRGLVLVFNPTDKAIMEEYALSDLGFAGSVWVSERLSGSGAALEPYHADDRLILKTPPHGCRLMVISEREPVRFCENNLWENLGD